jgi:TGS domain
LVFVVSFVLMTDNTSHCAAAAAAAAAVVLLLLLSNTTTEVIRRELLGQRVFVFLKDGKILNLNRGAAVIDAAFQIHTEVGLDMVSSCIVYIHIIPALCLHVAIVKHHVSSMHGSTKLIA